jgi:hypothetical protein
VVFSAQAQIIVHGNDFPAGEATPTNGSFSIRFPIPYKDVEHKGAETKIGDVRKAAMKVHMLTGVDREGLRFSATERPLRQPVPPIDRFPETSSRRPDAVASDGRHEQRDIWKFCRFIRNITRKYFFRAMRSKTTGYVLTVQCPTELRSKVIEMKDDFSNSFKIVRH